MKIIKISRIGSAIVLILILVLGFLKFWVLKFFADFILLVTRFFSLPIDGFLTYLQNQAVNDDLRHQSIGWIVYYPLYLLLHLAFIFLLFINNRKARNYVTIGLIGFVMGTIGLWFFFKVIGLPDIGDFFRLQFRKLFGLPFILLVIEGGRILLKDLIRKFDI